ncbi:glycosyltransferase family 2 protein, partial [Enterococcus faecium]
MKLSVIVPSYNVSNYLEECIESIVQQEISSMEVLIINDGSTDNT